MENTGVELLNLEHFKTKVKASDESQTTFIDFDIDFTTALLSFDINKKDKITVTSTQKNFLQHQILSKLFPSQNHYLKFYH